MEGQPILAPPRRAFQVSPHLVLGPAKLPYRLGKKLAGWLSLPLLDHEAQVGHDVAGETDRRTHMELRYRSSALDANRLHCTQSVPRGKIGRRVLVSPRRRSGVRSK